MIMCCNDALEKILPLLSPKRVGEVTGKAEPASNFEIGGLPVKDVLKNGDYHFQFIDDEEKCEYFVPVEWLDTKEILKTN